MRRRLVRLTLASFAFIAPLLGPRTGARALFAESVAFAQTEGELREARKLFAEAVRDEDDHREAAALEKFRRVKNVKDTQPVRYRIATCLEALGQLRDAMRAYESALDPSIPGQADDIARAVRTHMDALAKRLARLTVTLSPNAPSDARVQVDDEMIAPSSLGGSLIVQPGAHLITGTAKDVPPFQTSVTLPEGGQVSIRVMLEPVTIPAPHAAPIPTARPVPPPPPGPEIAPHPPPPSSSRRTWGYVGIAGGGALLVLGVVSFVVRHGDIAELNRSCPNGVCPLARQDDLSSTRSQALALGPLGYTLGGLGIAAAALGIYLLATPDDALPSARVTPFMVREGGGLSLTRTF